MGYVKVGRAGSLNLIRCKEQTDCVISHLKYPLEYIWYPAFVRYHNAIFLLGS